MTIFLTKRNNTKYSRESDCFKAFSLLYFNKTCDVVRREYPKVCVNLQTDVR